MRHILNWIAERFGSHVCHEFTQWQVHQSEVVKILSNNWSGVPNKEVPMTRKWQERRCTLCGKVYQQELKLF